MNQRSDTPGTDDPSSHTAKPAAARRQLIGKVLVADDNGPHRTLVARLLGVFGCTVTLATDGFEAVEAVTQAPEGFDLVLMDIQMPWLDGLAATSCIRAFEARHPERRRVAIIALTANAFAEEIAACRAAGMDDHLPKPIDVPKLYEAIASVLPAQAIAPAA